MTGSPLQRVIEYSRSTKRAVGRHIYSIWLLGLVAAALEGFGILLFIPVLGRMVSEESVGSPQSLAGWLTGWASHWSTEGLLLLLVALFAAKGLTVFVIGVYRARVFSRVRFDMRSRLMAGLERAKIQAVESRNVGTYGNLLVREIDGAAYSMDRFGAALGSSTTAVLLFGLAVALSPELSAVLIAAAALSLAIVRVLSGWAMRVSREQTRLGGAMNSLAVEMLQGFKYLRATERFPILQREFTRFARDQQRWDNRIDAIGTFRLAVREPLLVLWIALIFYLFVVVLKRSLSIISDGILLFYRTFIEIGHFQDHWHEFSTRVGGLEMSSRVQHEIEEAAEMSSGSARLVFERELRLDSVDFRYDGPPILRGVDLVVRKGETTALVGASGSGKSTIVDVIAGIRQPDRGLVTIDGMPIEDISRAEYRAALGYVTQESVIFSGSVAQNITMCWAAELSVGQLERAREAAEFANCLDVIESLEDGWEAQLGERGLRLSGGERQRIAIARELYAEPSLLILDEATSSLDSRAERAVQKSIDHLHGKVTLLLVAHRLSTVRGVDRIYVVVDGRILESGTFETLLREGDGYFRRLWELQRLG